MFTIFVVLFPSITISIHPIIPDYHRENFLQSNKPSKSAFIYLHAANGTLVEVIDVNNNSRVTFSDVGNHTRLQFSTTYGFTNGQEYYFLFGQGKHL